MDNDMPQPASGEMSERTADWYVSFTSGRLRKFRHEDGNWYLVDPRPAPNAAGPSAGMTTGSGSQGVSR